MATVPHVPGQYWGGTQDNGTLRKSLANNRWFDQASGDGGQVIVDQTTPNDGQPDACRRTSSAPTSASRRTATTRRRPTRSSATRRSTAASTSNDRAEFYVPWVQNRGNVNQMFLGTYRLYRTDNAETAERRRRHLDADQPATSPAAAPAPHPTARAAA